MRHGGPACRRRMLNGPRNPHCNREALPIVIDHTGLSRRMLQSSVGDEAEKSFTNNMCRRLIRS